MDRSLPRNLIFSAVLLTATSLSAALSDYVRTEIANYNGNEGLTLVKYDGLWQDGKHSRTGQAWIVKADLSYGYRLTARCGDKKGRRATVGEMAEEILADGVDRPLCGINADYFFMKEDYNRGPKGETMAVPVGFCISDSRLAHAGGEHFDSKWNAPWVLGRWFLMETADHQLVHAVPDATGPMSTDTFYVDGYKREITAHRPLYSWSMTVGGKKIRNAVQTGWCNYPVRDGKIYIIGQGQSRTQYPRVMVGLGKNALGHDQIAFFLNDGRHEEWSYGVYDEDAANMMIAEGCTDVGEFDGGGSAQMWAANGPDSVYPHDTTENGGYLNKADGDSLRPDATAIFLLKPRKHLEDWVVGDYLYETEAEARAAAADGEEVRFRWIEKVENGRRFCPWFSGELATSAAQGGEWRCADATNRAFAAAVAREIGQVGRVRLVTEATFAGVHCEQVLAEKLAEFGATSSYPHGAVIVADDGNGSLVWRCLVRERGQAVWKPLIGEARLQTAYAVMMDLDLKASVPRVRYLVSTDGENYYVLHDDEGRSWFETAAGVQDVQGMVEFLGSGEARGVRCVYTSTGTIFYAR